MTLLTEPMEQSRVDQKSGRTIKSVGYKFPESTVEKMKMYPFRSDIKLNSISGQASLLDRTRTVIVAIGLFSVFFPIVLAVNERSDNLVISLERFVLLGVGAVAIGVGLFWKKFLASMLKD